MAGVNFYFLKYDLATHFPDGVDLNKMKGLLKDVSDFANCYTDTTDFVASYYVDPTQTVIDATDAIVAGYNQIDLLKDAKLKQIDLRTKSLIEEGYVFEDAAKVLPLSIAHQTTVTMYRGDSKNIKYPLYFLTKDDRDYIRINNRNQMEKLAAKMERQISKHRESGTVLKKAVLSATTAAELDAILDDR